ncbi:hypothetical protein F2Q69_00021309 [Brassica cretica]|uniref:Uncharacterized protein n=1 Tax=Brassica cretica TaxID=69181 RepID=A0A8S9Q3D7_BRACR|nr:hypothetical protein F2Q69_00021309 [Brassica cretica]
MAVENPTMQRMLSERRAALGLPVRDPEESDPNRQQPSNPTNYFEDISSTVDKCVIQLARNECSSQSGVVRKEKRAYFQREWNSFDVMRTLTVTIVHSLCLLAPFNYKWEALRFGMVLFAVVELSITFSYYHRNLAHRSFKLPKWLEYPFAYSAVFALQRMLSERRAALGLPVRDPEESDPNRQQPSNSTDYFEDM